MASIGGDTNTLVRKFMKRKTRKRTPADLKYPRAGQGENAKFSRFGSKPPGLPRNVSPTPSEGDALFNPLVHGNRKMGSRNKGPVKRGRTKY